MAKLYLADGSHDRTGTTEKLVGRGLLWGGLIGLLSLLIAGCGVGASDAVTLDEYEELVESGVEELILVQDEILASEDPSLQDVERLFAISQTYLESMAEIAPPEEISDAHEAWVVSAEELQNGVREFLDDSDAASFSIDRLNADLRTALLAHKETCRQLERVASETGLNLSLGCLAR